MANIYSKAGFIISRAFYRLASLLDLGLRLVAFLDFESLSLSLPLPPCTLLVLPSFSSRLTGDADLRRATTFLELLRLECAEEEEDEESESLELPDPELESELLSLLSEDDEDALKIRSRRGVLTRNLIVVTGQETLNVTHDLRFFFDAFLLFDSNARCSSRSFSNLSANPFLQSGPRLASRLAMT